jgi:deoxyribonuclease V
VAGFGRAFLNNKVISTIVVFDFKTLKLVESKYSISNIKFPYIPGLLSYRESPGFVDAYNKLENEPDIILVPAHGVLHPRKLGMASHIGLLLDKPTIGIAKALVSGEVINGKVFFDNELLGIELETRDHSKPIYVSIGHKISLKTAFDIVKKLTKEPHKMPEPLHEANKLAKKLAKKLKEKNDRSI